MTLQEREEMDRLCRLIQSETDLARFIRLVEQLKDLLGDAEYQLRFPRTKAAD
ncbi:MAG TPA: hypothetical protein VKQ11_04795 [Candidatus Sulfotelmatobacter sp.]|nr:hypothetical protein [Candidatus Sulfotelmatobacter sp.]